ncbi:MAG: DoxX family protein [Bacteroidota bacterium]
MNLNYLISAISSVLFIAIAFSGISFIVFGLSCLFSKFMVSEFQRYGLQKFRILNGYLQILGGIGLLIGLSYLPLALTSSFGLTVLMLCGFLVRLKIKDGFVKSFPAFFYMLLNLFIVIQSFDIILFNK